MFQKNNQYVMHRGASDFATTALITVGMFFKKQCYVGKL